MAQARALPYKMIAPDTFCIDEFGGANCYLLLGDERALLIDTGNGLGDLRGTVAALTDLPVDVVATHAHADHTGGASQFPALYLHKADTAFVYKMAQLPLVSKGLLRAPLYKEQGLSKKDLVKGPYKPEVRAFGDDHVFALGGRDIRIVRTPGHTRGSVVLLDDREQLMFTGDNVCPGVWLWVPGATSVQAWLPGARRTLELAGTYTAYAGHGEGPQTADQIARLIACAEELLRSQPRNALFSRMRIYPSKEMAEQPGAVSVWYRTGNLYR